MFSRLKDFLSTKVVKKKILNNQLSEGQLFAYFYLTLLFDTGSFTLQSLSVAGKQMTMLDAVNIYGLFIVNAVGFLILFMMNGAANGKDFLKKYFPLSFTIGLKYFIVFLLLSIAPQFSQPVFAMALFVIINVAMVANIGYRIYELRTY